MRRLLLLLGAVTASLLVAAPATAQGTLGARVGYGFGLGFAVRRETGLSAVVGSAGEYRWGGAAGTAFWIDPKEQIVGVFMTQNQPGPARRYDRELFQQLVYQAIAD